MIYFTIIPSQKAGFTDQLMQFSILYIIGNTMGYRYAHTPFSSARSSGIGRTSGSFIEPSGSAVLEEQSIPGTPVADENVFDFIGFNDYFNNLNPIDTIEVDLIKNTPLSDDLFKNNKIESLSGLLDYLGNTIDRVENADDKNILVQFCIQGTRRFTGLILSDDRAKQYTVNLRQIYNRKRMLSPHPVLFTSNKRRILVHIRQGDIGVIRTPWNTFIPVDGRMKGWMTEFSSFNEILPLRDVNQLIEPADFYRFLTAFLHSLKDPQYEMLLFSDGYARAFQMISDYSGNFKFTDEQKAQLRNIALSYDQMTFSCFESIRNCQLIIGESLSQLYDLIHSVFSADIVIVGIQQRMIVKLITQFCGDDKPAVIVLYRTEIPDLSNIHPRDSERFIYADLNDFNIDELMVRVNEKMSEDKM